MRRERIVAEYLDSKLYSDKNRFVGIRRTDGLDAQMRGSDIVASIPELGVFNAIIDEKAQMYYLDGGLPTFAFELNFLTSTNLRVEGWFTDESKTTQFYMLIWLTADKWFESISGIHRIEYALLNRRKLLDYLATQGFDRDALRRKGRDIAESGISGDHDKDPRRQFYFYNSTQLAESPVNVIVRKTQLLQLSDLRGFI